MELTFYKLSKRSNSTKQPSSTTESLVVSNVRLKDGVSIYTPTFIVNANIKSYNYIKWVDDTNTRYYFINDFVYVRNDIYQIDCNLDYLATYKSAILNTKARVEYCTGGNISQIDTRLPLLGIVTRNITREYIFHVRQGADGDEGCIVLNHVSDGDRYYSYSGLDEGDLTALQNKLTDTSTNGFVTWLNNAKYALSSASEAILGCRWIPFDVFREQTHTVHLSSYNTGVVAWNVEPKIHFTANITIPKRYDDYDYRMSSYTTTWKLYLPYYGFIDLNAEELRNRAIVKVDLYCDGRDGNGYYIVNDNAKYNTNFAVNYQFGLIRMSDPLSVGLGVAKSVGAFAMGDMLTAGASITSAVLQGAHKEVGTTGPSGGTAELEYNQGEMMLIEYFSLPHDAPSNYKDTIGLPDGAVKELYLCGNGYVQTLNASVSTGVESVNNIINQYLDGGIYIE